MRKYRERCSFYFSLGASAVVCDVSSGLLGTLKVLSMFSAGLVCAAGIVDECSIKSADLSTIGEGSYFRNVVS